uniref:Uncharacterized protein n=1 Tax=Anguilla anguilla TaxID=7936 RepID=A0A0E9Q956_ANGAN
MGWYDGGVVFWYVNFLSWQNRILLR